MIYRKVTSKKLIKWESGSRNIVTLTQNLVEVRKLFKKIQKNLPTVLGAMCKCLKGFPGPVKDSRLGVVRVALLRKLTQNLLDISEKNLVQIRQRDIATRSFWVLVAIS